MQKMKSKIHQLNRSIVALLVLLLSAPSLVWAQKILIIGDSLTEGYGVAKEKAYPALVEQKLNAQKKSSEPWQVINSGISGSTTASATSRVKWGLKAQPQVLVLALGANDVLRGFPIKEIRQNLDSALAVIQAESQVRPLKIMLFGMLAPPNYGKAYTEDFAKMYRDLAQKYHCRLFPFLLEGVAGHPELNQADGLHPNEKGHQILAANVFRFLQEDL